MCIYVCMCVSVSEYNHIESIDDVMRRECVCICMQFTHSHHTQKHSVQSIGRHTPHRAAVTHTPTLTATRK